jgi:8-oxo-dGTP diphosphatase
MAHWLENVIKFGSESIEVKWFNIKKVPSLAWDHSNILEVSLIKLRDRLLEKPIGFELLQKKFTLPQLQVLYEAILGKSLDKRNFRKKIISMHLLKRLKEKDRVGKGRAANLYRFDKHTY